MYTVQPALTVRAGPYFEYTDPIRVVGPTPEIQNIVPYKGSTGVKKKENRKKKERKKERFEEGGDIRRELDE